MNATYTIGYEAPVGIELKALAEHAAEIRRGAKFGLMLIGAPLLGLAFIIVLPFAGLGYLGWMAIKALPRACAAAAPVTKRIALFALAPFVGLAYVIAFPMVGLGALAYYAVRAARN